MAREGRPFGAGPRPTPFPPHWDELRPCEDDATYVDRFQLELATLDWSLADGTIDHAEYAVLSRYLARALRPVGTPA